MTTPELISTVDLGHRPNNTAAYQFVYASQVYGTLFAAFGQFEGTTTADDSEFHVQYIKLMIINYRGLLNIRFKNPLLRKEKGEDIIFFDLQAAGSEDDASVDLRTEPIVVRRGERRILNFKRMLYPLKDLPGADPDPNPMEPIGSVPDSDIFDTEFYYRNGIDCYHNIPRPGMIGCIGEEDLEKNHSKVTRPFDPGIPSGRCHESFVSLVYH